MAGTQIQDLDQLGAAPAAGDLLVMIDVSDTTDDPDGTNKLVSVSDLAGAADVARLNAITAMGA